MKVDLLRDLLDLNQAFGQVIHGLERMEKVRFLRAESIRYARAEVETARADTNREFFDHFAELVENDTLWAYKFRREYDRKTQDPFDFYLELQEREDQRKKKGLTPRAVLLPGWDQDDDERQHEKASANERKNTVRTSKQRPKQPARLHQIGPGQAAERKRGK